MIKLRHELTAVWPGLCRDMDTGDIEEFARRLAIWAREGHFPMLQEYAAKLLANIEAFDVDQIPETLRQFSAVCDSLTKAQERGL
jgi:hypothetical protein